MSPFPCLSTNPRFLNCLHSKTMSLPFQSLSLTSPSSSTLCFSTLFSRNPSVSLGFPPSRFPNTLHFQILDYKFRSPFNFGSIDAHQFCPRVSTSGGVGRIPGGGGGGGDFDIDSLLSAAELFCLVASLIGSVGFALNCAKTRSKSVFLAVFGDGVLVGAILFLVAGVAIGAWIRRRQWNRVFRETVKGVLEVNLMEKTNKLEEDLRSSATLIRVLSRQLEKLGIRFRVTRKALKKPVEETAALAQKTSEATRALAVRGDILEKELAEIQKVLLAMQEQQQKQLELILAIGKSGKMWESRQELYKRAPSSFRSFSLSLPNINPPQIHLHFHFPLPPNTHFPTFHFLMDSLPDAIVQCILSHMSNARDVAVCNCVSKRWKDSTPYIRSLYFPRNSFDNHSGGLSPDNIIWRIISSIVHLEELVVYSPFTGAGLSSWLSSVGPSLRHLELRMDNLVDLQACQESPSKLECLKSAANLETLKLWGVLMTHSPRWDVFQKLKNLEIVGAKFEDPALNTALHACPNLSNLLLLACEGLSSVSIELKHLEQCKLDFYGLGNCSLLINAPKLQLLEVQGCSWIRARGTSSLRNLSIANNHGRVYMVDFDKLVSLETLSLRGIQWCWSAISRILECGSEVKHLYMKVEFTGDFDALEPFPEIDFVEFFNNHPKLQKFDIHGAMFAALCQKHSLKSVDPDFAISCLEEVWVTVRSPLNAEQKMNTLESFTKYAKNLKALVINILRMKSSHGSADDFFDDICKFRHCHPKIVRIE